MDGGRACALLSGVLWCLVLLNADRIDQLRRGVAGHGRRERDWALDTRREKGSPVTPLRPKLHSANA
jgi:hypothetical protein